MTGVLAVQPPGFRFAEITCWVRSNEPVNRDYRHLVLDAPSGIPECRPGQFFQLLCPFGDGRKPFLRRPMSVYGFSAEAGELQFLYKPAGEGTAAMAALRPGQSFNVFGPLGNGFEVRPQWRHLLLVARGVGLATLAPLAMESRSLGRRLTAICSARSTDVLMSVEHFRDLGADVICVTDEEGDSGVEALEAVIEGLIADGRVDALYTCGSNRLLKLLQTLGRRHSIPGQVALEQQMACGIGMCQCCVRAFRRDGRIVHERVCREGPVFDIQEAVAW